MPVLANSLRAILVAAALAGCTPIVSTHGQTPDPDVLAEIEPGRSSRTTVEEKLGTPSTRGVFDPNVWYYMSEKTETVAFFAPELIERKIVAIQFDEGGMVKDIVTYTENDKKEVDLVSRVTPTAGNEISVIQQLFGNLGRFNR